MDFKDAILQLSERIEKQRDSISTEEATKNAFIMPMISILGYDIFNPFEVVPEMDCDITKKKGEKIDYAIMKGDEPIILIESKHCKQNLNLHETQLKKYFVASNARFGVLTNGIEYNFYTDLDKANIMDDKPFLVVNMLNLSDNDIEQLKKFHKSYYNEQEILSIAAQLQIMLAIKELIINDFQNPSHEFVRYFIREINKGKSTIKQIEQYTPLVKKSISNYVNDVISERLNLAIKNESGQKTNLQKQENEEHREGIVFEDKENGIITTQEEIDAYNIIRSILRKHIDVKKITYTDNKAYFVVKISYFSWICRLSLNKSSKRICFPKDNYKSNEWFDIDSLDDIFKYEEKLVEALEMATK